MGELKLLFEEEQDLPLREVVFNTLRQGILTGILKPGERLMEIHLAKRLGVSRTPIREAIRMLELEGLVTMIPRKGAEVAMISKQDLSDVLEVRRVLDGLATSLASKRISEEEKILLKKAADDFVKSITSGDVTTIAEADVYFHDVILKASGNRQLILMMNNLAERIYRYRLEYIKDTNNHASLIREHEEILEHVLNGNGQQAADAAKKHIDNQEINVLNHLETL